MAFSPCSCCRNVFSCSGKANFSCNIYKRLDRTYVSYVVSLFGNKHDGLVYCSEEINI